MLVDDLEEKCIRAHFNKMNSTKTECIIIIITSMTIAWKIDLEEKMDASPLQQDEQLKDGMLKQVKLSLKNIIITTMKSYSLAMQLPTLGYVDFPIMLPTFTFSGQIFVNTCDSSVFQFDKSLNQEAPFENICLIMLSSQAAGEEKGAKSRITLLPEPSHMRQASKRSWQNIIKSGLYDIISGQATTSNAFGQAFNSFWKTESSSSGLSQNWKSKNIVIIIRMQTW